MTITLRELDAEVRAMARYGGIDPREVVVVLWTPAEERDRTARDFAYVYGPIPEIHFSRYTLELGGSHREALIAHELGHVMAIRRWNDHSEPAADRAALEFLGIPICYDHAYPGKGLQVTCRMPNPLDVVGEYIDPKDGRVTTYLMQPFPFERKPYVPTELERQAHPARVPLSSMVATQHKVTAHGVTRYQGEHGADPLVYRTPNGKAYIADGHHRLTAAWLRDDYDAQCNVVDIEANPHRSCMPRAYGVADRLAHGISR